MICAGPVQETELGFAHVISSASRRRTAEYSERRVESGGFDLHGDRHRQPGLALSQDLAGAGDERRRGALPGGVHPLASFCAEAINKGLAQLPFALSLPAWHQEWLTLSAIGVAMLLRAGQDPHVMCAARRRPVLYGKAIASFAVIGLFYSVTLLGLLGLVIALRVMTYSTSDKRVQDRTMAAAGDCGWATLFAVAMFYAVDYTLQMSSVAAF
jgi:hypothetical protein